MSQRIEIAPASYGFAFNVYRTEAINFEDVLHTLKKDELSADLEKLKPGFIKIEGYDRSFVSSVFAFPQKKEVEALKKGLVCKLEIPVLDTARILFPDRSATSGHLVVSGSASAYKMALQWLSPFVNISGTYIRPDQERLFELSEQAVVVKAQAFTCIPHAEIEKITLSGELEDIYSYELPLREAEISFTQGVFSTPAGVVTIKYSRAGKTTIAKRKNASVSLELLKWAIEQIA